MYLGRIEKLLAAYSALPMCVINAQGKVSMVGKKMDEVFLYDKIYDMDGFALTGIKHCDLIEATKSGTALMIDRNDKKFRLLTSFIGRGETASIAVYFQDVTTYEWVKERYNEEKMCMAIVNVDNFDELSKSTGADGQMEVATQIDSVIRQWGGKMDASITRYKDHQYFLAFYYSHYEKLVQDKFSILDNIRKIETKSDFPVSLSIGIGIGGKNPAETDQYAEDALDLALGRGGDQAVVKNVKKIEYYGGKMQTVEKGNKGKSRIIAHALRQLIKQSSKVLIMGHSNPDMDCFGAALGINRIAASVNKDAYIIINEYTEALSAIYDAARATEDYNFITSEKAIPMADGHTLVVVLDTHRPSLVECPEILDTADKLVVIDHHRKAEESIENMTLAYMEPYASSTSELVTEIVQYSQEKKILTKMDAEALLAGITVDTNQFGVKTGVRTFEAASWLRRSGAETTQVKKYFQTDIESFRIRASCIANAQFLESDIAMSVCPGQNPNAQIVNSQVADELLNIKGIKASFVAGKNQHGETVVSARSLGEVNVQLIMEKLGGGGHLTTAGAQVETTPEETIEQLKEILPEFL